MRRAGLLFGAGLLVGATAMYFVRADHAGVATPVVTSASNDPPSPSATGGSAPRAIDFLELVAGSVDVTERAALYQFAAKADRATIVSLASQVDALPKIPSRAVALEVLLTRYAELDAPAAAALARELELEAAVTAPLFAAWAQRDSNAALRTLADLDGPAAMTIGVALLEILGNDDLGIARVLGAAPQLDPDRFRAEAAIARAAADPEAAIEDALRLPASKRGNALTAIATAWAKDDVLGALAHVDYIEDNDRRNAFKGAVLRQWALDDPEALLAYVFDLSADAQSEAMRDGTLYAPLSALEPLRALEAADALAGPAAAMVRRTALMQLAADDPLGALRHVESLPLGAERQQVLNSIATAYGRLDPEAAIAWAQSQNAPELLTSVLAGVVRVNPDRAMDLLLSIPLGEQARILQTLPMTSNLRGEQIAVIADRLLAQPSRGPALQMLTNSWAQRTPEEALRWLLAHDGSAASSISQAGMNLARTNPAAAIGYFDRIPTELRARWISAVADGYAQNDARAAANWVTQYRGEAGYEAAVAAVASRTAQHDPATAARLFSSIDVSQAPDAAQSARAIALSWARQDTAAAASWARELGDDAIARGAVSVVTNHWAARDAAAARNWTMSLPTGAKRDAALVQIVGATAGTASGEPRLLDAFSSPTAQQAGASEAVRIIAQRDADAARRFADEYLTDPGARQAAERFIEQSSNGMMFGPPPPRVPPQR